jgi:hypothetical protein
MVFGFDWKISWKQICVGRLSILVLFCEVTVIVKAKKSVR